MLFLIFPDVKYQIVCTNFALAFKITTLGFGIPLATSVLKCMLHPALNLRFGRNYLDRELRNANCCGLFLGKKIVGLKFQVERLVLKAKQNKQ